MREAEEAPFEKKKSETIRPSIIAWQGVKMVRHHSFLATVGEIVEWSKEIDLTKVGIIGDQHSGKSTLAQAIAHVIHKTHPLPFSVKLLTREKLMNFEKTLQELQATNYILIFDDVSFLGATATKTQVDKIKKAVTEIRHLEGGADVKIITILNYHYTLGLDKYLRMSDFRYFTSVGSSETENIEAIVGRKRMDVVRKFQAMRRKGVVNKFFTVTLGKKEGFGYRWRDPFIPVLFYNNDSLRQIVTPTRQWIDPICSACTESESNVTSEASIEDLCTRGEVNFGSKNWLAAVKLQLYVSGYTTYGNHVVQALRWLNRARASKIITLEDLAVRYGLTITKTRLRKKPF